MSRNLACDDGVIRGGGGNCPKCHWSGRVEGRAVAPKCKPRLIGIVCGIGCGEAYSPIMVDVVTPPRVQVDLYRRWNCGRGVCPERVVFVADAEPFTTRLDGMEVGVLVTTVNMLFGQAKPRAVILQLGVEHLEGVRDGDLVVGTSFGVFTQIPHTIGT